MFSGAHDIMSWLSDCAARIAKTNQTVGWVTPLGLPVVQPYRSLPLLPHLPCDLLSPVAVAHCHTVFGLLSPAAAVSPLQALLSSPDRQVTLILVSCIERRDLEPLAPF